MSTIRDTVLENAMAQLKEEKKSKEALAQTNNEKKVDKHISDNKLKTFQKRARLSIEAMFLINILRRVGWDFDRIATCANVSEQTIKRWATGEAVPHLNNLIILRQLKEKINKVG